MHIVTGSWGSLRLSAVNSIFVLKSNLSCTTIVYLLISRMASAETNFIVEVTMAAYLSLLSYYYKPFRSFLSSRLFELVKVKIV